MNNSTPTPKAKADADKGSPRTLERDVKIVAAGIVAVLLTIIAWQLAGDVTSRLAVTYSSKLLMLRLPFFLAGVALIWAGAASYIANLLGKSFRNVVFDRRNLIVAQRLLLTFAVLEAIRAYAYSELVKEETRKAIEPYSLSITAVIIILVLRGFQERYGVRENQRVISSTFARDEYKGGRFSLGAVIWGFVGLALATLLGLLAWREFEFGLSNAPERMALRGYVPRESVSAAIAVRVPPFAEPRIIVAPTASTPGATNWSEAVVRQRGSATYLHYTLPPDQRELVRVWKDGVETHFTNELAAFVIKFRSVTNVAIPVPLREFTEEEWRQLPH